MVRIARSGTEVLGTAEDLARAREDFDRNHCVKLRRLLAPDLMAEVTARLSDDAFSPNTHPGLKTELVMTRNATLARLHLLVNDDDFLRLVGEVTGVAPGYFVGRVYRMVPGGGHHDDWHNDCLEGRVLAMSVNLSEQPYSGGSLLLRRASDHEVLCDLPNTGAGDAIIFRVHPSLEHRVADVDGTTAKTAFAGWFLAAGSFVGFLRSRGD